MSGQTNRNTDAPVDPKKLDEVIYGFAKFARKGVMRTRSVGTKVRRLATALVQAEDKLAEWQVTHKYCRADAANLGEAPMSAAERRERATQILKAYSTNDVPDAEAMAVEIFGLRRHNERLSNRLIEAQQKIRTHAEQNMRTTFRRIVDVVWGKAHDDLSVPSTDFADRMIDEALATIGVERPEAIEDHSTHGRGHAENGPDDPSCGCREAAAACARVGCGFCRAFTSAENWKRVMLDKIVQARWLIESEVDGPQIQKACDLLSEVIAGKPIKLEPATVTSAPQTQVGIPRFCTVCASRLTDASDAEAAKLDEKSTPRCFTHNMRGEFANQHCYRCGCELIFSNRDGGICGPCGRGQRGELTPADKARAVNAPDKFDAEGRRKGGDLSAEIQRRLAEARDPSTDKVPHELFRHLNFSVVDHHDGKITLLTLDVGGNRYPVDLSFQQAHELRLVLGRWVTSKAPPAFETVYESPGSYFKWTDQETLRLEVDGYGAVCNLTPSEVDNMQEALTFWVTQKLMGHKSSKVKKPTVSEAGPQPAHDGDPKPCSQCGNFGGHFHGCLKDPKQFNQAVLSTLAAPLSVDTLSRTTHALPPAPENAKLMAELEANTLGLGGKPVTDGELTELSKAPSFMLHSRMARELIAWRRLGQLIVAHDGSASEHNYDSTGYGENVKRINAGDWS